MARWLLKTEPSEFSFEDLTRTPETLWDGVTNPQALKYLGQMQRGDEVLIYHTGNEKAIVGRAIVQRVEFTEESANAVGRGKRLPLVYLSADAGLAVPVPLAAMKAEPAFAESALVRQGRLSVMPVDDAVWNWVQAYQE